MPSLTVATSSLLETHVTVLSEASSGMTVAVSVAVSPLVNASSVLSSVIVETCTKTLETFTLQVASLSPAFAVTVAVPSPVAVITPSLTVTTPSLLEVQVTVLSDASSGSTVATSSAVSPMNRSISDLSRVMLSTAVGRSS